MSANRTKFNRRCFLGSLGAGAVGLAAMQAAVFAAPPTKRKLSHRERIERALTLRKRIGCPSASGGISPIRIVPPAARAVVAGTSAKARFGLHQVHALRPVFRRGLGRHARRQGRQRASRAGRLSDQEAGGLARPGAFSGTEGEISWCWRPTDRAVRHREHVPLVQTVFSPLTTALKLAGPEKLLAHLRAAPAAVHAGLAIIAETTRRFATGRYSRRRWTVLCQPDGQPGLLDGSRVRGVRKEVRHDRAGGREGPLLVQHPAPARRKGDDRRGARLSGPGNQLSRSRGGPSLAEMRKKTKKCLIGGIGHTTTLVHGTPADVDAQVRDAWRQVNHRGLILGPGCVGSLESPEANILQLRKSVEKTAS